MNLAELQSKFARILELVKQDLATIRTGKASPALVENLFVEAYGTKMRLVELSSVAATDPTTLLITPFDVANSEAIAKAIQVANLGLTATVEDTKVRVVVPPLSQERREEYVKLAKTKVEGGKVMARQARHDAMEDAAKANLDEDSMKRLEKDIQEQTDKTVAELDLLALEKEKELLTL
ncbi:MAG: ribosome recycling factor [Patescibacteria group bacterium]|nr:ribosome recycling factor [Patescibacteria group bacterium]MCL5432181.1 ribosome recycling factor [Patescibacteria group bacterium]